jgi:hypothetical protein
MQRSCLTLIALLWLAASSLADAQSSHGHLRRRRLYRQYHLLSPSEIQSTLLRFKNDYPNLVKVTTAQEKYGLPAAGGSSDCPYDEGDGCLNYIITIQDFLVSPEGSASFNRLPEVLLSGELHGNERVGPTSVMEAASLLLEAAQCESSYVYDPKLHESCSASLLAQGIDKKQRQWLARLVATRRIVIVPTANALGYYQNTRTEGDIDVNRDFPFDNDVSTMCMQSIGGRTLNEVFRESMFQIALTFHGGIEMIGYEWGADSYAGVVSPDDEAQNQIATAYSHYGGGWSQSAPYLVGPMDQIIYTVKGGMEDWAYAGSWIPEKVVACQPTTYGGYPTEKTIYNDSMLRSFNMLVETSNDKMPTYDLGTTFDALNSATSGNGHVSRNIRVALLSADLVEPYLSFVGVNDLALSSDVLPLTEMPCRGMNSVKVPASLTEVTVEWTVGGALEIDETSLFYGNWNSVAGVGCLSQPQSDLSSSLTPGLLQTQATGTGYFSKFGVSPSSASATGDSPLGPVFKATVDLSQFVVGAEVVVVVKARVDQSWVQQPNGVVPQVQPQAHIVNARTNPNWYHQSNGKVIQGRQDWYSTIPLTLVISNTTSELHQ